MGFYKFFRVCFFIAVVSLSAWFFVFISPNNCDCSSQTVHNTIWAITGIFFAVPILIIVYMEPFNPLDTQLFFKLFNIPKEKYKYTVNEAIDIKDNTSKYYPLVKTTIFYPAFYIHLFKNGSYNLVDPKHYMETEEGYDSETEAMRAIACVKLDINENSFKYQYSKWFCHICWMKDECRRKVANKKPLDVKFTTTYNKSRL